MSNSVNLALDVTKTGIQNPLIKVRQGDGGFETLRTTVTANGEPMDLQGWTITFMGTTAGNHKIVDTNVTVVEAPNGIFDYTPSKAWGMDIGEFKIAYFKFVKGDGAASSANFRVNVIEAVDLTQEEAQNYISVVDATIAEVREHLESSLADITASVAATSSAASSLAVNVSSVVSSAVNDVDSAASNASSVASSAAYNVSSVASSAVSNVSAVAAGVVDKLNNISVGGRNLFLNSKVLLDSYGINSNATVTVELFDSATNMWHIVSPQGLGINVGIYMIGFATGKIPNDSDWSFSADIKGTGNIRAFGIEDTTKVTTKGTIGSNWSRFSQTGHSGTLPLKTIVIYFDTTNSPVDVYIKLPKLEIGNVPTDWTPAPEDAPSNDAQLVHKTGTETIAGDKTFTSTINGNAATATKWQTARTLALTGDIVGSVSMDGSGNASMATTGANLVHKTGAETISGDKTFTGTLNAAQKIYTRTIGSTADLQIIYTRVGNVVTGRYTVAKSGVFTLSNNDGYKAPTAYPVNVIATNINAWFTTDNRFSAPDGASQGNFMFITSDPLPAN